MCIPPVLAFLSHLDDPFQDGPSVQLVLVEQARQGFPQLVVPYIHARVALVVGQVDVGGHGPLSEAVPVVPEIPLDNIVDIDFPSGHGVPALLEILVRRDGHDAGAVQPVKEVVSDLLRQGAFPQQLVRYAVHDGPQLRPPAFRDRKYIQKILPQVPFGDNGL